MILVKNRHKFKVVDTYEAGLVLVGCEVKSVVGKEADLSGSYVLITDDGAWMHNVYIRAFNTPYFTATENRPIKLLLNRSELRKLKGEQIIPLELHTKNGKVKVTLGVVVKMKKFDHRAKEREKEHKKEIKEI